MADGHHSGCLFCGKPTKTFKSSGRAMKYCSNTCADRARRARLGMVPKRFRSEQTCRNCGVTYMPREANRTKFCSRECAFEHKRSKKVRASRIYCRECRVCGRVFTARRVNTKDCSDECAGDAARIASVKRYQASPYVSQCRICGTAFVGDGSHKRTCSDDCHDLAKARAAERAREASHEAKHRRRAKIKGSMIGPVGRITVFKRDNWCCQACGCNTPRHLMGTTHDDAPELDHITPLAVGGAHTLNNVQTLCRLCNLLKGAMTYPEFTRWLGATANEIATGGIKSSPFACFPPRV
jgi:5-methylcytosine-specific restriction endonuclease McrA